MIFYLYRIIHYLDCIEQSQDAVLLIGCSQGDCAEVELPCAPQPYTIASYELVQCRPRIFKFHSVKSAIRRESIRLAREKKREEIMAKKREELVQLIAENPGIEINEEEFFGNLYIVLMKGQ